MSNAVRILQRLDQYLTSPVELTLYGRAALTLGFEKTPEDYALSRDVDAILPVGQAETLNETTNFWEAIDLVNADLADDGLYVSHFFTEDQVVLLPEWKDQRVRLAGDWKRLDVFRLGNVDLLLSKLMRDDPIDRSDAWFIVQSGGLSRDDVAAAVRRARLPRSEEVREQFAVASKRLLDRLDIREG